MAILEIWLLKSANVVPSDGPACRGGPTMRQVENLSYHSLHVSQHIRKEPLVLANGFQVMLNSTSLAPALRPSPSVPIVMRVLSRSHAPRGNGLDGRSADLVTELAPLARSSSERGAQCLPGGNRHEVIADYAHSWPFPPQA